VDARKLGEAGLVGWRAEAGKRAARWISQRTRFEERDIAQLIGAYLFLSRARRMMQMLRRLRRI
jgi:hypothetical protein